MPYLTCAIVHKTLLVDLSVFLAVAQVKPALCRKAARFSQGIEPVFFARTHAGWRGVLQTEEAGGFGRLTRIFCTVGTPCPPSMCRSGWVRMATVGGQTLRTLPG